VSSTARARRPRSFVLRIAVGLVAGLAALATGLPAEASQPAQAAPVAARPGYAAAVAAPAATAALGKGTTSVDALRITGSRTRVTVGKVTRRGQVTWIDHVVDDRLVDVDGCQARRVTGTPRRHVYRASVYAICPGAPTRADRAARALVKAKPWYRVTVQHQTLTGFSLLADLPSGNDKAVPAALAKLPTGPSVFFEGDDVALTYSGPGVTQARLDAAVRAFAAALGVPPGEITVSPLR
jgi:hypothetical protein